MNKKIFAILAVLILLFSLSFSWSKGKTEEANTLIVGTNSEFPPFSFRENKEIVGFDIDVAKEVAKRLNKQIQFKDMPFDALIPDLTFGNISFIAAGMTYTEERGKRVAFTQAYLSGDPLVIVTLASKPKAISLNDLFGKTVVVNEGYTADLFLSGKEGLNLIRLSAPADAFLALKSGRGDAFVTARSTVKSFLETQDAAQYETHEIDGENDQYALVVSKNNPQLLEAIQQALDEMERDGTLARLKTKWKFT